VNESVFCAFLFVFFSLGWKVGEVGGDEKESREGRWGNYQKKKKKKEMGTTDKC
jgi:hypothetical protein